MNTQPAESPKPNRPNRLHIVGPPYFDAGCNRSGYLVEVDDRPTSLHQAWIETLVVLVVHLKAGNLPESFFHLETFVRERLEIEREAGYQRIRKLGRVIPIFEPRNNGWWQITMPAESISLDRDRLKKYHSGVIADAIQLLEEHDPGK